ncbi:MAG TPA: OB-fold nucleic acid binding domain-containing protein [Candidatus Eremiobacteraceae bacterium]|nr:OB-fold nucleic acid binding domain-containing protein [Candidatus Eremiobacteraceae bacterium]
MTAFARETCGALTARDDGRSVDLRGWVNHVRDHGGLLFVDLRDRFGITQIVFDPAQSREAAELAGTLRSEDVVAARGRVR